MSNNMNSARCKACDTNFAPSWIEERGLFEDMCFKCRDWAGLGKSLAEENAIQSITETMTSEQDANRLGDLYLDDPYAEMWREGAER